MIPVERLTKDADLVLDDPAHDGDGRTCSRCGTSLGAWHAWSSLEAGPSLWPLIGAALPKKLSAVLDWVIDRRRDDLAELPPKQQEQRLAKLDAKARSFLKRHGGVPDVVHPAPKQEKPSALSRALVDAAQPSRTRTRRIFHAAACTYVSLGEFDKAFTQVELAVKHRYEELGQLKRDADLGELRTWPKLKAVFASRKS